MRRAIAASMLALALSPAQAGSQAGIQPGTGGDKRVGIQVKTPVGAQVGTQVGTQVERAVATDRAGRADDHRFDRCFVFAGERYGVSPLLLKAVARQESGLNPAATNRNANGSTDIGLMQINSSWLPVLARHGVKEDDLRVPCANILVGAWILGSNFRSMGRTVDALGAYNARDPVKRQAYARQVLRHYVALDSRLSAGLNAGRSVEPGAETGAGPVATGSVRQVR